LIIAGIETWSFFLLLDDQTLVAVVLEVLARAAAELLGTLAADLQKYIMERSPNNS